LFLSQVLFCTIFAFVYICSVRVYFSFNRNEQQLLIISKESIINYYRLLEIISCLVDSFIVTVVHMICPPLALDMRAKMAAPASALLEVLYRIDKAEGRIECDMKTFCDLLQIIMKSQCLKLHLSFHFREESTLQHKELSTLRHNILQLSET